MAMNRARIDGIELAYVDQGEGPPVVLVHGGMSDHRIWGDHCPILASRYRVIAPTLRYFGSLPWPDDGRNFSIQTHADDLAAFIGSLRLGPVAVVGWSYGGAVSLTMALQNPELVKHLLVYEPGLATFVTDPVAAGRVAEDRLQVFGPGKAAADSGDLDGAVRIMTDGVNGRDGDFRQMPDGTQAIMLENGRVLPLHFAAPPAPPVTRKELERLGIPVGIAVGEDSRAFYQITAEAAHRCIRGSDLIKVPKARHLWPGQDPAAFSRFVLDFLESDRQPAIAS